jgi:predicted adenylyl cyclase CyaB
MPSNIEIKARVNDPDRMRRRIEAVSEAPPTLLLQEDVFFHSSQGRLKLRILSDDRGELIYYQRPDTADAKRSDYMISPASTPWELREVLSSALGVLGVVKKQRLLYLVGQTRIHLDDVERLGHFMELEVVMNSGQAMEEGHRVAQELMDKLEIKAADLIDCAYIDLPSGKAFDSSDGTPPIES